MKEKINIEKIKQLLEEKKLEELKDLVGDLHPTDFSDIAQSLSPGQIVNGYKGRFSVPICPL